MPLCAAATHVHSSNLSQVRFLCEAGVAEKNFSWKFNHSFEDIGKSWCSSLVHVRKESIMGKDKWLGKSDPSSFSNPEDIRTESLSLRWKLDFVQKVITGSVVHDLVVVNPDAKELVSFFYRNNDQNGHY